MVESRHLPPPRTLRARRRRVGVNLAGESGQTLVLATLMIIPIMALAALAIDLAVLFQARTYLQRMADASAHAAVQRLPMREEMVATAQEYASRNDVYGDIIVTAEDVTPGNWVAGTFTPDGTPLNAVRVITHRTAERGNPVPLYFARVLGKMTGDVRAMAIAVYGFSGSTSRFLIDEEMIDSDIPVIEQLAAFHGMGSEEIISDNDGDWFIDLPPGEILELPTGQVGDAALFDIQFAEFQFQNASDPSFEDFLNYNEDSNSWRYDLVPKEMLDPLIGVDPVEDPSKYPTFVDPTRCQVSPIFKSDVSDLGDSKVNALGWRRGLLAFKILRIGSDPDGSGSKLPNIVIEVCDPAMYPPTLGEVGPWGDERIRLVK